MKRWVVWLMVIAPLATRGDVMLDVHFNTEDALRGWHYVADVRKPENRVEIRSPDDAPALPEGLRVAPGSRWISPPFAAVPFAYYRAGFLYQAADADPAAFNRNVWSVTFYDARDQALAADVYGAVDSVGEWRENTAWFRPDDRAVSVRFAFHGAASDLKIQRLRVERLTAAEAVAWADALYAALPPVRWIPAGDEDRFRNLPRTMETFRRGGSLRVVLLGDSIINDTQNGLFELLLHRRFPGLDLQIIPSVRGSTHCWFYQEPENFRSYVAALQPDWLMIGGVSHRDQIDPIRNVIQMAADEIGCEILLMSGPVRDDWRTPPAGLAVEAPLPVFSYEPAPFDRALAALAEEMSVGFFDIGTAWNEYLAASGLPYRHLMRDRIHANDRGKQILARLIERFFTANPDGIE